MNKLLLEGLTDAVGFLAGALLGFLIGRLLGWDMFATGTDAGSWGAILLSGLGGGAGVQGARALRRRLGKGS
jgi:F0F1-type ATP synthase assembly protein I